MAIDSPNRAISTKLTHDMYAYEISDEFDYGSYPQLFALVFGKIAESDFVYTLSYTNINQSTPNLVKMFVIIRSQMSSTMDLIGPELSELSALKLEKMP